MQFEFKHHQLYFLFFKRQVLNYIHVCEKVFIVISISSSGGSREGKLKSLNKRIS